MERFERWAGPVERAAATRLRCVVSRAGTLWPFDQRLGIRVFASALFAAVLTMASVRAQSSSDPDAPAVSRFTGPRWSMIRPARDFEGGCVVGFLAFSFSETGYFVFNNRVRGSWRIDELGNLKLRTRDGLQFTLYVEGDTLRTYDKLPFIKRTDLFQRCPS